MGEHTAEVVREEVRAWLDDQWDPDLTLAAWWERLADSGWAVPTWPTEWLGRGLSRELAGVVAQEFRNAGAAGAPAGLGVLLAGPTILAHGTDEQKTRYLRPIVDGSEAWCQLFSEPGAGSDLASLQTRRARRRRVGDQRPEGVDVGWADGRPGHAARAHRSRRAEARRASRTSRSRWTSRASRCGRCAR